jgi:hypothetical protein
MATEKVAGPDGLILERGEDAKLNDAVKHAFGTAPGKRVLEWLESITIRRVAGPGVNTDHLMHLEGGRYIVAAINARIQSAKERKPYATVEPKKSIVSQRRARP